MKDGKLPLGIMKQAIMKYDSALTDIHEILGDEDLEGINREHMIKIADVTSEIMTLLTVIISDELDEDEFIGLKINMDPIDSFPGDDIDIGDIDIGDSKLVVSDIDFDALTNDN